LPEGSRTIRVTVDADPDVRPRESLRSGLQPRGISGVKPALGTIRSVIVSDS
jgi:hypothetical protein